jgi:type VI secretion system protein ImpA
VPLPHDDLLAPLPSGAKGENLRYDAVYDKIKDARQEDEDDSSQGDWQRTRKKADFNAVIKLANSALTSRSKDLQIAVWLAEAFIRRDGFKALADCFNLLRELQDRFWDSLYPELEDGDAEFRATPQEWLAGRCDYLLRRIALTKKGMDWIKYYDGRDTSRERLAMAGKASDDEKRAARDKAVAFRESAAQEFNQLFEATPKAFYTAAFDQLKAGREALAQLEAFCDEKYGSVAPNFAKLRTALDDVSQAVSELLDKKREKEPDEVPQEETTEQAETAAPLEEAAAAPGKTRADGSAFAAKLASPDDAFAAITRAAEFLRNADPSLVAPYMVVRSLRWAELRAGGDSLDQALLVAPSTELRQNLRRLFLNQEWGDLLSATEAATALPCGRAWIDLHRYAWAALREQCYSTVAQAICSELRALISDFPSLPDSVLDDGTPVASSDTKSWLEEHVVPPKQPDPVAYLPSRSGESEQADAAGNGAADPFEEAMQLARTQQFPKAIELMMHQRLPEDSGRERFLRQLKIAQLCLATAQFSIAYPILRDLFSEIEQRKLLEWESAKFLVQPLSLLVRCIDKTDQGGEQRAAIYNLLCRLEPAEALRLQSS